MNSSLFFRNSPWLLAVVLMLEGCVVSGTLDEAGTQTSSGSSGDATEPGTGTLAPEVPTESGGAVLDSSTSSGGGELSCADYVPSSSECDSVGTLSASIGYSYDVREALEDTECSIDRIDRIDREGDEDAVELGFSCPTGKPTLTIRTNAPQFSLPFGEGETVLLTINGQGASAAVRKLDGALLFAFVQVDGFEPDIDLGPIEIEPRPSGCSGQPVVPDIVSCSAGGTAVNARIPLEITSDGSAGATVFEGHSAVFDSEGQSMLFLVNYAREAVCWDDDCVGEFEYVTRAGAMSILLVAEL